MSRASLVKAAVVRTGAAARWSAEALLVPPTRSLVPEAGPAPPAAETPGLRSEVERVREQARKEGYAQGQEQAVRDARLAVQEQLSRLERLIMSIDKAWERERERAEAMLSEFAFVAVRRMLGEALQDRALAVSAVRGALAACKGWQRLVIEVHPEEVNATRFALEASAEEMSGVLDIVGNGAITLGGCRIVSDEGALDARLETQFGELRRALDAARRA